MARLILEQFAFDSTKVWTFMEAYETFMKVMVPSTFIGMKIVSYHLEKNDGSHTPCNFKIIVETNKNLNQGSRSMLTFYTQGFIAGYKACSMKSGEEEG